MVFVVEASELHAGFPAAPLTVKPVLVSKATSEPELSAGVGYGVVVPLHHVVPTRPRVQSLVAAVWRSGGEENTQIIIDVEEMEEISTNLFTHQMLFVLR